MCRVVFPSVVKAAQLLKLRFVLLHLVTDMLYFQSELWVWFLCPSCVACPLAWLCWYSFRVLESVKELPSPSSISLAQNR